MRSGENNKNNEQAGNRTLAGNKGNDKALRSRFSVFWYTVFLFFISQRIFFFSKVLVDDCNQNDQIFVSSSFPFASFYELYAKWRALRDNGTVNLAHFRNMAISQGQPE